MFNFPKDFLWGAATSAHQVEGNNKNDWSEWEKANAERLSKESGGKYPPENYISGKACDHYNRFREDFDIAKSLGHNAHRFSIEWSRIEPEGGKFNEKEIEHYREVIKALRERGLEPFVTLWHWTIPIWMRDKGGVTSKEFPKYFAIFSEKMAKNFPEVKFWVTLNEPEIYTMNSYLHGEWPPQKKSFWKFLKVYKNLVKVHKVAHKVIRDINNSAQIGIAKNNSYFEGWLTPALNHFWNNWFLNKIKDYQDFIGLNYYFHNQTYGFRFNQNKNKEVSDMGWEIYPEGVYQVLKELKKYNKPIYITENGVADARDIHREKFIKEHLEWVAKAIGEGVDVRGYFYWSLLDNFEWDKGFWPRFGLVEVDYKTMQRKIRKSAQILSTLLSNVG